MIDILWLILAVLAGMALSVPMFGGLWLTLRRLPAVRHPWLWVLLSFWGRLLVTMAGVYVVAAGDWRRALAVLLGLLIGRTILVRRLGRPRPATVKRRA